MYRYVKINMSADNILLKTRFIFVFIITILYVTVKEKCADIKHNK